MFIGFRNTDTLIDVLKSVIKPTVESIGIKLYKRMKRLAKIETKDNEPKTYGCEVPSNKSENNDFSYVFNKPKTDLFGIGYKSIAEDNDPYQAKGSNGVSAVFKSGRKIKISGEAFGYGVLDEDIEEDAVVYHKDDMSQYDLEIGFTRPQHKRNKSNNKTTDVLKSDVIEGFAKCTNKMNFMEMVLKKYPKPVLPKNWKSASRERKETKRSRWDQPVLASDNSSSVATKDDKRATKPPVLNANIRAILLGEEVIHKQGTKKHSLEPKVNISHDLKKVFTPEAKESEIQKKNESFLNRPLTGFWANKFTRSSDGVDDTVTGGLTQFKDNKTVKSDENAAKDDNINKATVRTTYEWHPHHLLCKRFNIPHPFPQFSDFVGVVTVGKSDVRNRTSQISDKKVKPNIFDCLFNDKVLSNCGSNESTPNVESESITDKTVKSVENKLKNIDTNNEEDVEESDSTTRPPMDLFKAIFASDEESDGEDIETNKSNNENIPNFNEESEQTKSNDLNAMKTTGIFANIDFDQLNRNFTPILKPNETICTTDAKNICESIAEKSISKLNESLEESKVDSQANDDLLYGPSLPPDSSLYALNSFVDSKETKNKSLKRKKKEKKDKKHRHKKEKTSQTTSHSKHKRHRKSSTSSSSSKQTLIRKF